jgi:leucyl/phenylalanyl-tRNA--protein transferase
VRLVQPASEFEAAFRDMAREYVAAGEGRGREALEDFAAYLDHCRALERDDIGGWMPQSTFWLLNDAGDRILGTCRVRHGLNEGLLRDGGHIGYDIRPSERNKGHGTKILALALDEARRIGLPAVLITVAEDNASSIRVVEKNGGRPSGRVPDSNMLRFVIELVRVLEDEGDELPGAEFPPVHGVVAVGGTVTAERVLEGYRRGIFPWPLDVEGPMVWWSPDPRFVLYPGELHVGRSLEQRVRSGRFEVRLDEDFEAVIDGCTRPEGWITPEIRAAYLRLFETGRAHCAASWREGRLAGGLYGVSLGGVFFGESMFAHEADASKVAFVCLVRQLARWGFGLVDCQQETDHLARFGARALPRERFLAELERLTALPNRPGPWRFEEPS